MNKFIVLILILFSNMVVSSENQSDGKAAVLECLAIYNQSMKIYRSQSINEKFDFTLQVLEHSFGKDKAEEYLAQKNIALSKESVMDSFFEAIMTDITEACVKNAPHTS